MSPIYLRQMSALPLTNFQLEIAKTLEQADTNN